MKYLKELTKVDINKLRNTRKLKDSPNAVIWLFQVYVDVDFQDSKWRLAGKVRANEQIVNRTFKFRNLRSTFPKYMLVKSWL